MRTNDTSGASFTRADRRRLERALRTAALARVYRRIEAVLLVAEGHAIGAAARHVRADRGSVRRWVAAYRRTRDPAALDDRPRRGRRRSAPELTGALVTATLAKDPRALGYRATTWTVPLLVSYLAEHHGCRASERTLRRRLHEWGYRWKRPRYAYTGRPAHRALAGKKGLSPAA